MITEKIKLAKEKHKQEMDWLSVEIADHFKSGGKEYCDYILGRQERINYHRGAWNALNELEKEL